MSASDDAPLAHDDICAWLQEQTESSHAHLAHRLHDELGGLLTAAKMDVSWLQGRAEGTLPRERLAQLAAVLDEAMDLKRRLVEELRPSLLEHFGLATALRSHANQVASAAKLELTLRLDEDCDPMPRQLAMALFRVAQAALLRVVAAGRAQHLELELGCGDDGYCLVLNQDGGTQGLSFEAGDGQAWLALQHRLRALGGSLELPGGAGEPLRATLPRSRRG